MKSCLKNFSLSAMLLLLLCSRPLSAQNGLLEQLSAEEQQTVEAIALYPEKERHAILLAVTHPEILARMQHMQRRSQEEFRELITNLPEEQQKDIYELIRYPELIEELTAGEERKSRDELREMAEGYPDGVEELLMQAERDHLTLLRQISAHYREADESFEMLLARYPPEVGEAYRELVKLPEVLQVLADNMNATVLLGDIYQQDPGQLKKKLDSLNVVVAEQKARELVEWQQSLEENPEAMEEYEQAAKSFAMEQGYTEEEVVHDRPEEKATQLFIHHVWRPYPFWFGWPYWYSYSYWYPYPWWYHAGFYYGPGNTIVFVGLPSFPFVDWHFYHHRHFYYYPHFTHVVIRYTERYPGRRNNVTRRVSRWREDVRREVPRNWLENDGRRPQRIRELGAFRMAYDNEVRKRRTNAPTEREYLQRHARRYPGLSPLLREAPARERVRVQEPEARPPREVQSRRERTARQPTTRQPTDNRSRTRVLDQPQTQQQKRDKARVHHENTWERARPTPPRVERPRRSEPSPQVSPPRIPKARTREKRSN